MTRTVLPVCLAVNLSVVACAQDIEGTLEKAKNAYKEANEKARAALLDAFETASKAATATGNLDAVKAVRAEKEAFETNGKLPTSARMQTAVVNYRASTKQATRVMEQAYEEAVKDLTKAGKIAEAEAVQTALNAFRTQSPVSLRPSDVTTKEQLQQYLAGTSWALGDGTKLKPNGYVENRDWDRRGLVTKWQAIDRRTVLFILEKGRDNNRYAILTFSEDLSEFTGYDFERANKFPLAKRKP